VRNGDLAGIDFGLPWEEASPAQNQAVCLYECMRWSKGLRDELNGRGGSDQELQVPYDPNVMFARVLGNVRRLGRSTLQSPFLPDLTFSQLGVLFVALQRAGFPGPWTQLNDASKTELVSLLGGVTKRRLRRDKETYPLVIIEEGAAEFDPLENCWRMGQLEPGELGLFKGKEYRNSFVGFIRISDGCTKAEVMEAIRHKERKHKPTKRGGGGANWRARLNQLVVMRIWEQFPEREHAIKRVELVAKFTTAGFKGCKDFWKERCDSIKAGRYVDQRISEAAEVEMSRALSGARAFFHELFPGEEPRSVKSGQKQGPM
jgi:hypothetical protein